MLDRERECEIAGHECCSVRFTLLEFYSIAVGTDSDSPNYY